jgi:hypothetical protein
MTMGAATTHRRRNAINREKAFLRIACPKFQTGHANVSAIVAGRAFAIE